MELTARPGARRPTISTRSCANSEPYLHRREGRYDFYHMSIRRAVEVHYLKWEDEEDQHDPWLRWNPDRQPPAGEPTEPERETRHRLIACLRDQPARPAIDGRTSLAAGPVAKLASSSSTCSAT